MCISIFVYMYWSGNPIKMLPRPPTRSKSGAVGSVGRYIHYLFSQANPIMRLRKAGPMVIVTKLYVVIFLVCMYRK